MPETKIFDGIIQPLQIKGSSGGALSGATFVAKDNFDIAGCQTAAGVPDWARTHPVAAATAPAVKALLNAGATLTGKSCMDELAFSFDGINIHYGIAANPNRPGCIPGGSSSGSASAVASGICDLALGTDTAGSVRVPAAFCGVFGMRPTYGRISTSGIVPLGPSFDTVGWFARDPALFVKCGEVLLNESVKNIAPPQVDLIGNCLELLDGQLRQAFMAAIRQLNLEINTDEPVRLPPTALERWVSLFNTIRGFECWQYFGKWIEETNPEMQDVIKRRFLNCRTISEAEKIQAESERKEAITYLQNLLEGRILCLPTVFDWPLACRSSEEELVIHRKRNLLLTIPAVIGGLPQVSMPICLPGSAARFGLSFMAPPGADSQLLALCRQVKQGLSPVPGS